MTRTERRRMSLRAAAFLRMEKRESPMHVANHHEVNFGFTGCRAGVPHLQPLAVYASEALDLGRPTSSTARARVLKRVG